MCVSVPHIRNRPVLLNANTVVFYGERVAWGQLEDILKCCPWRKSYPECENLVHSQRINFPGYLGASKQSFDLGREDEGIRGLRVKQWPNARAVAREEKLLFPRIPNGKCPLTVEVIDTAFAVFPVCIKNYFRVRTSDEAVPLLDQLLPQFDIVENFAVKSDPQTAVRRGHRLRTTF